MKLSDYKQHFLYTFIGIAVILLYFYPALFGKGMLQGDIVQFKGMFQEANQYNASGDEEVLWTNTSFSGMPIWRGFGNNLLTPIHKAAEAILTNPAYLSFYAFIGFYILLIAFGVSPVLSLAGGLAFVFSSFNIISIEAGHINKVADMALMAPVIGGLIYLYRGKFLKGLAITTFFAGFHIYYSHYQISYYLLIIILFFVAAELFKAYKSKNIKRFIIASSLALLCAVIGLLPNISKLWTNYEYGKLTTRGGTELTKAEKKETGLDKDYVFAWSYGVKETFTLLIPGFHGGSSNESLTEKSQVYNTMISNGVKPFQASEYIKNMPMYWGNQPFTSGPVYFGAIVCFLFVFGLVAIKGPHKWWIASVSFLAIMLSWGKNFELLSDLFYNYVPLYNKFRSVTMILSIAQLGFPLLGFIALSDFVKGKISGKDFTSALKISLIVTGGFSLLFLVLGGAFFDFVATADANFPEWLRGAIRQDRASLLRTDSFRSLFFIAAAALLIFLLYKKKLQEKWFYPAFIILIVADMWFVNKRYLNSENFYDLDKKMAEVYRKTEADKAILEENTSHARVFNLTRNPFSDGTTSYHHKSIGGYSAIKLARYQDLIEHHLSNNNMAVLNMLNTEYFITSDKNRPEPRLQKNPGALGNAWFVKNYKIVEGPDEEIAALNDFDPAETAIVDKRFKEHFTNLETAGEIGGSINLTKYHPNHLDYEIEAPKKQMAVFSEIYFRPGWNAYIDGKPVEHFRVNYILRGLVIPEGKHHVQFKFEPAYYFTSEKVALAGSIIFYSIIALCIAGIIRDNRKKPSKEEDSLNIKKNTVV